MPTLIQQEEGWLSTAPNEIGTIIPIRKPTETFELDSVKIKSSAGEDLIKLAPHYIIVLNSEVRFKVSDRVAFELILHPTLPIQTVEPEAERL